MKILFILSSILLSLEAYADINLNENILSDCKIDQNGVMNGCITREEPIAGISAFEQRKDLKFKYKIDYKYSCKSNRLTNINIVSENDNLTLGNFKYLGGTIEGEANSRLVIKDFSPTNTGRARYNKACKLEITKIEQDFSTASLETIKRDICSMKGLNSLMAENQMLLFFSQSLENNVGVLTIDKLQDKLNYLKKYLITLKSRYSDNEVTELIDEVIGKDINPTTGTINNILQNAKTWGQGSARLVQNLGSLYNYMQAIDVSLGNKIDSQAKKIYKRNIYIEKYKSMPSISELYSNLMFEYNTLNELDTADFKEAKCS